MLELRLRFPASRYHATPWDHHVNEGIVEWPPSPWRLLRALVATWHLKGEGDGEPLQGLVERLATELPSYRLPPAIGAHTRHYMPIGGDKTAKVFDAFLHVGAQPIVVRWPGLELPDAELRLLAQLVARIGYLGRAESWVEGEVAAEAGSGDMDVRPLEPGEGAGPGAEVVRVLAPVPPGDYARWRVSELGRRGTPSKKPGKKEQALMQTLPPTLFGALTVDTGQLRSVGWSQPPGSRWVEYRRPSAKAAPMVVRSRPVVDKPTVARYALAGPVLPRLTDAVTFADRVRRALLSWSGRSPILSGRDESGTLLFGHRHAFVLPEANERFGRISHVTVFARDGFGHRELRALDHLRVLRDSRADDETIEDPKERGRPTRLHDVQMVLLGVGRPGSFGADDREQMEAGRCPLLGESSVWVSRTPFVPTRHPKTTRAGEPKRDEGGLQIGSPEHDLRRLLRELGRDVPDPLRVTPVAGTDLGGKPTRWSAFRTIRKDGGGRRATASGYGFRIEFPAPVRGPIAVGYGAHFGLGCFAPEGVFGEVPSGRA